MESLLEETEMKEIIHTAFNNPALRFQDLLTEISLLSQTLSSLWSLKNIFVKGYVFNLNLQKLFMSIARY